ncbi:MAG: hypothetical protein JNN32_13285, partial [Flavobacteriales bacterium]|nr:hypothetical protein [Flavobacteriales bacterium]
MLINQNHRVVFVATLCFAVLAGLNSCSSPNQEAEPDGPQAIAGAAERIERGKYLVETMGCHDCHSPKLMGPNGPYLDPDRVLSGYPADRPLPPLPATHEGWALMTMDLTAAVGPWGTTFAANITSDESGIGNW